MARVGRVQSMISRWYCSAAFLTSCILGNRCSTSIRGKDKTVLCVAVFFFPKWIVFQLAKDAQNSRRWRTDASRDRKENEPNYFVEGGAQFHLQFETRFLAIESLLQFKGGNDCSLTNSNQRKFVGVRNDAFKCWHNTRNTHRTTRAGALAKSTQTVYALNHWVRMCPRRNCITELVRAGGGGTVGGGGIFVDETFVVWTNPRNPQDSGQWNRTLIVFFNNWFFCKYKKRS